MRRAIRRKRRFWFLAQASTRTIAKAIRARDIYFRKLRAKPTLTKQDIKDRVAFAASYAGRTSQWWNRAVHMHIDVKHFSIFLDGKGRRHIAQVGCRGAYRGLGERFAPGTVKPNPKVKYSSGVPGVKVLAGVGNGKVLLWQFIESRWSGQVAADMYKGPMLEALQNAYPRKRRFTVLEDNDPSGFKSSKGVAAKAEARVCVFLGSRMLLRMPLVALCGVYACQQPLWGGPSWFTTILVDACAHALRITSLALCSHRRSLAREANIVPFVIPKRSPDLNVCDYALWQEVNKRMRAQEKAWADSKKETRKEFLARLRRTAMRLPSSFVQRAIGNMTHRCEKLKAAKGFHFEEGSRGK